MNILLHIKSDRLDDIKVAEGTTVAEVLMLLQGAGYDVKDAVIRVFDPETKRTYIGDVESFVLKDFNGIQFRTNTLRLDNTIDVLGKEMFSNMRKNAPSVTDCKCKECKCNKDDQPEQLRKVEMYMTPDGQLVARPVQD